MKKTTVVLLAVATLLASAIPSSAVAGQRQGTGGKPASSAARCPEPGGTYKVTVRRTDQLVLNGELYFSHKWEGRQKVTGATKQPGWPDWLLLTDSKGEWYVEESTCKLVMEMEPTERPGHSRWRSLTLRQTNDGNVYIATGYVDGVSQGHGYRQGVFVMCSILTSSC